MVMLQNGNEVINCSLECHTHWIYGNTEFLLVTMERYLIKLID